MAVDGIFYNRLKLQADLGLAGSTFNAASLLAMAYLKWGEKMLRRLDGDFAFAVCDWGNRKVFVATDPNGMRPMFHRYDRGEAFVFSTDIESLALWIGFDQRIPESRLLEPLFNAEVLAYFDPEIPGTSRLLAAHSCHADETSLCSSRYWTPADKNPGLSESDQMGWIEGVRWHFREAVRKRLADGARAGILLSGGLDSSAVLAMACEMTPDHGVAAYSVVNRGDPTCPETIAVDRMLSMAPVKSVQTDVMDMAVQGALARELITRAPRFVIGRAGFLNVFNQMAATSGVQVMMDGIDADALFDCSDLVERQVRGGQFTRALRNARKLDRLAGGPWLVPEVRRTRLKNLVPDGLRAGMRVVRGSFRREGSFDPLMRQDAIARFHLKERLQDCRLLLQSEPAASTASGLPASSMQRPYTLDAVARYPYRARHLGIEMRCPFLDRSLIEFAAWVPLELRMRDGRFKWILRKAMTPYLPHSVAWRGDKHHLGSHFDRVMLQPVLDQTVRDFRGSEPMIAPYVNRKRFMLLAEQWRAGAIEAVWELKMFLIFELWLRHNQDKVRFGR